MNNMIDSRDANKILIALTKCFNIDKIGVHCYDGVELFCCGLKSNHTIELLHAERLYINGSHTTDWYELPLSSKIRTKVYNSNIMFRAYRFLTLEDIAYFLKMHLCDIQAYAAQILLFQILNYGIYIDYNQTKKNNFTFKVKSLEEILVHADLI